MNSMQSLLTEWRDAALEREIDKLAFTPVGIVALIGHAECGILDLAPSKRNIPLSGSEARAVADTFLADAAAVGITQTAEAIDAHGAFHWRVKIVKPEAAS